jgi:hypothetical protein
VNEVREPAAPGWVLVMTVGVLAPVASSCQAVPVTEQHIDGMS